MPDPRFFSVLKPLSLGEAVEICGGDLTNGQPSNVATHVAPIDAEKLHGAAVYCTEVDKIAGLVGANPALCITTPSLSEKLANHIACLAVPSPRLAFALLGSRLHRSFSESSFAGENLEQASISQSAKIHPSAVIGDKAEIGADAKVGPHAVIGPGVVIGEGSEIGAGVTITHSIIGARVAILPGACVGQAGFGFVEGPTGLVRVPQLGRVVVSDDVEIGANTTIDRGALKDTIIGAGTKIDNLVQIGHNVEFGVNCIVAGQTGISGSCVIGDRVMIGGKVGLIDHLRIGNDAQIAAGSGLMRDVPAGEKWGGRPARPVREWLKETATLTRLANKKSR